MTGSSFNIAPSKRPGDPIYASEMNDVIREVTRLGRFGNDANVISTGAGMFFRNTPKAPAGNTFKIGFEIISSDPSIRQALVTIVSRPAGISPSDLPGTSLDGTVATVCDIMGCFLNEPNVDLTGRAGYAEWMEPIDGSVDIICGHYGPHWEVFSICCPTNDCIA